MELIQQPSDYQNLVNQISFAFLEGQKRAVSAVNSHLVETNWRVGQYIVEFEQGGKARAAFGKELLENLSKDLSLMHGKGFSMSNIARMRQFYQHFPILAELPQELSWTHFIELLKIEDPLERSFYEKQTILEKWSTTELIRQKKTLLFLRLAATKDIEGILKLVKQGQIIENPIDLI
jgi:DUF1016 N-terminal domain